MPTYAAGSEEMAAYNKLNAARDLCGFGMLAQSTVLDTTAKGHADWQMINNMEFHFQTAGTPGFTGVSADERAIAAG